MNSKAIAIAAVSLGVALPTATALAASISNTGTVKGAMDSVVSLKVVTKGGKAKKLKAFSVQNAPAHCDGGAGQVSASFGKALTVAKDGKFNGEVTKSSGPGGSFKLSGKVKNGGKKVTGTLSIDKSFPPPMGECNTGNKKWTAKAG